MCSSDLIQRLLAKMPTVCAMIYKQSIGHPTIYPDNNLDYVSNFLNMTFKNVTEDYELDPVIVEAMNKLLILHADHEQNCSTSTVRIVGSSHANLYTSVAAGIAALWGPLHGGANQKVILSGLHQDLHHDLVHLIHIMLIKGILPLFAQVHALLFNSGQKW